MVNDVNQSMKKVKNPITNQPDLVKIMSILVTTVDNITDYFDNGKRFRHSFTPRRFPGVSRLFRGGIADPGAFHRGTGDLGVRAAGNRGSGPVSAHREPIADRKPAIDLPVGTERVQSADARVVLRVLPGLSAAFPRARDLRRQRFGRLRIVCRMADRLSRSFNSALLSFGNDPLVVLVVLRRLLLLFSSILTPYCPRKSQPLTLSLDPSLPSTTSVSTFSAHAARILQKAQMQQAADGLSVPHYQLIMKLLTVVQIHVPQLEHVEDRL